MSYKISVKTDGDFFTVDCCEFEHFADAKAQVGKMIVDLMTSHIEHDYVGCWEEFKDEFPEEVLSIIESFEKKTSRLLFSYKPDIRLFEEVSVFAWPTKYPFYEKP